MRIKYISLSLIPLSSPTKEALFIAKTPMNALHVRRFCSFFAHGKLNQKQQELSHV